MRTPFKNFDFLLFVLFLFLIFGLKSCHNVAAQVPDKLIDNINNVKCENEEEINKIKLLLQKYIERDEILSTCTVYDNKAKALMTNRGKLDENQDFSLDILENDIKNLLAEFNY